MRSIALKEKKKLLNKHLKELITGRENKLNIGKTRNLK